MSEIPHCTGCGEYPGDLVAALIEHLQAQRNFAQKQVVMAEAKLAKAVEALGKVCHLVDEQYADRLYCQNVAGWEYCGDDLKNVANTTLAKLKGGSDD